MTNKEAARVLQKEVNGIPEDLNDEHTERFQEAVRIATQALNTMPFIQDMSDTIDGLRAENEVILRRLKHLLASDYISQFDQVDPNTQEYIRDIREADRKVMYLCGQKKPCKEHCEKYHHCKHTSDISHAKNFRLVPNGIYPIIFEEVDEHSIAKVTFDREELEKIVEERVIEPIKNGELVIKEERPHGEWTEHYDSSDGFTWLTCSRCMFKAYQDDYKFCPNCGAEMRKEAENEHL